MSASITTTGLRAAGRRFVKAARSFVAPALQRKKTSHAPKTAASLRKMSKASRPKSFYSRFNTSKVSKHFFGKSNSAERQVGFKHAEYSYKAQVDLFNAASRDQGAAINRLA